MNPNPYLYNNPEMVQNLEQSPLGLYFKLIYWSSTHPNTAFALICVYSLALIISIIHILTNFKGADRICWFLVVMMLPIAGLPMYWLIGINEKITESESDYIKRMDSYRTGRPQL